MQKTNYIDLHTHSIASIDGTYTAKELIDIAIDSGIRYYAVSDHDNVSSIASAFDYAQGKDIVVIPAIEISSIIGNYPLHILGYNIDYNSKGIKDRVEFVRNALNGFAEAAIKKSLEYGFKFNPDDVYAMRDDHLVCEEMIGQAVLGNPENDNDERLVEFRYPNRLSDNPTFNFYKEFFGKGKPLNIVYDFNMPINQASKLIHDNGGKMFLAHPTYNIGHDEKILEEIISYGLDGIEVFSSYHNDKDTEFYYNQAKAHNLMMSVGSDFHGRSKPAIKMGSIDYDEDELIKTLKLLEVYR